MKSPVARSLMTNHQRTLMHSAPAAYLQGNFGPIPIKANDFNKKKQARSQRSCLL